MKYFLAMTLGLAALWFLLSGTYTLDYPLIQAFGVISIALTLWIAARFGLFDSEGAPVNLFPGILGYWAWLFLEIGKANFVVARAALAVTPMAAPKMFRVKAEPQTDMGKVILANSITLTPGTVSVDLHDGEILVHALTEELADVSGIEAMGRRVCALEGRRA